MDESAPAVGVIMGSQTDWETMRHAVDTLDALEVGCEARIISAHRTPKRLTAYVEGARERGLRVIIAGAGGAAHLEFSVRVHHRQPGGIVAAIFQLLEPAEKNRYGGFFAHVTDDSAHPPSVPCWRLVASSLSCRPS